MGKLLLIIFPLEPVIFFVCFVVPRGPTADVGKIAGVCEILQRPTWGDNRLSTYVQIVLEESSSYIYGYRQWMRYHLAFSPTYTGEAMRSERAVVDGMFCVVGYYR